MSVLLYVQSIPEAVAMWRLQIKRSRVRFPHWNFFFPLLFFCLIFPPFFFLHARSVISMLKHFSSYSTLSNIFTKFLCTVFVLCMKGGICTCMPLTSTPTLHPPFEKSGYGPAIVIQLKGYCAPSNLCQLASKFPKVTTIKFSTDHTL